MAATVDVMQRRTVGWALAGIGIPVVGVAVPVGVLVAVSLISAEQGFFLLHLGFGVLMLHAFAGGIGTLLRPSMSSTQHAIRVMSTSGLAAVTWLAVVTGTWLVYPLYSEGAPEGADLAAYPREFLTADPSLAFWHDFGMEWKEHVAWLTPFLATAVAFIVLRYGAQVAADRTFRLGVTSLFVACFLASLAAAALGAVINIAAPNEFLRGQQ